MLSSAIIVFREVFEIVLIVGIVLAATRGIPHRGKAIFFGIAGGLAGSGIVAFFTGAISDFAEGLGQEYFNAAILFVAAGFIGWTLLWMKRHGREMKAHFSKIGESVALGRLPFLSLSAVIALAIVREGSEIALFTYGMLASGQSPAALMTGSAIGMVGGAVVGTLLYLGLIKLSTRHFFQVTSWLLVFLVAGMMSQGTGFLTAAGLFGNLSKTVWDSSWLLSEQGITGQSLKALIGYTAQPTIIQLIIYTLTLGTLTMLMKYTDTSGQKKRPAVTAALLMTAFLFGASTQAHATKKVYQPYVEEGEIEIEWRGGYDIDDDSDKDGAWKQKLGLGYGVNEYWFTEIYGEVEKDGRSNADTEFTAIEWENRFQLTTPGEYWLDAGVLLELVYNTAGGADKAEGKLLLAKDAGDFSHTANFIIEQEFGDGDSHDLEGGLAWSSRYRYRPEFEPGFEIYNEFGSLENDDNSFDDQKHRIGPVAYGHLGVFKYDIGYLFGISDAAPDGTLKAIIEYEF